MWFQLEILTVIRVCICVFRSVVKHFGSCGKCKLHGVLEIKNYLTSCFSKYFDVLRLHIFDSHSVLNIFKQGKGTFRRIIIFLITYMLSHNIYTFIKYILPVTNFLLKAIYQFFTAISQFLLNPLCNVKYLVIRNIEKRCW